MRPDLVGHLTETFGFAIDIEFQESSLVIGSQCTAIIKTNMVFNVCVNLIGLTNNDASDSTGTTYALAHSDTVIVYAPPDTSTDQPPYLKLIVDCWERIMDFLSFEDLLAMGQTCKAMNLLTGCYVRENFCDFYVIQNETINYFGSSHVIHVPTNFWPFINELRIMQKVNLNLDAKTFPALKSLFFYGKSFKTEFHHFKNVLMKVEKISLHACDVTGQMIDQLLNCCPKLKRLHVIHCSVSDADNDVWFSRHYPALEHLEYFFNTNIQIDNSLSFLKTHSKLKSFVTNAHILYENRNFFKETNIQLNILEINLRYADNYDIVQLFDALKDLHDHGFYRVLHLSFVDFVVNNIDWVTLNSIFGTSSSIDLNV